MADAMNFVKYTGISEQQQNIIWQIVNEDEAPTLTYRQMVIAIRLVSYAQAGIPLTIENLNSNLRCRLPVLVLADDGQEQVKPPPFKQHKHPSQQQTPKQPFQPVPPIQQNLLSERQLSSFSNHWQSLHPRNGIIKGDDVKQLYKHYTERQKLAQAWRLSCTHKRGHLTKGEFFVFEKMIQLQTLPQELSKRYIEIIKCIDDQHNPQLNLQRNQLQQAHRSLENSHKTLQTAINEYKNSMSNVMTQLQLVSDKTEQFDRRLDRIEHTIIGVKSALMQSSHQSEQDRVLAISQKQQETIKRILSGEYQLDVMMEQIIYMGKVMNNLTEQQIVGIRQRLVGQSFENIKSLHEQAIEKYQEYMQELNK